MTNPLNKRFPRELRNNLGKYLGIFFMLVVAVAFTGGFLLAANSMEAILNRMDEKYKIEDGRFICDFEADNAGIAAVEELEVKVYPDFYRQVNMELGSSGDGAGNIHARLYENRSTINLAAYAEGRAPQTENEAAFDRVFLANHKLGIGDSVKLDGKDFEIVGICTLPDYQALFESNTNFVHNAISFTVGQLTREGMDRLDINSEVYQYSFVFDDQSLDLAAHTSIEEDMVEALSDNDCVVSDLIDAEDNQGIGYAVNDVVADRTVFMVVLFLLIIIMAFVFAVLTGATIESESSVIGTMLASGWRKGELLRHYMVLPTLIGLVSVVIGLILGVTLLSDPLRGLYYNSYGIPPYELHWDASIVFFTTVLPFILLVGITFVSLLRKLRFTPLEFLRHETTSRKRRANVSLPDGLSYPTRFRLRVLLRNASHFVTLFFGIAFASLLLLFGTCLLPVVQNYAAQLRKTVTSPYQYVLKAPLELEGSAEEREKCAAALRLIEDRERIDANQDAIDAAERLEDNKELMDALERLTDNKALMDALERLQDNDALMEAVDRLQEQDDVLEAAERLNEQAGVLEAAARVAQGAPTAEDMALLQSIDEQTRTDIEVLSNISEQTRNDLDLIADADEQTADDIDLIRNVDEATQADIDLIRNVDETTQADIDLVRDMDESLFDDIRLAADIDEDANPVNTQENSTAAIEQAEKFAMASVEIKREMTDKFETVTVYGIQPNSRYWTDVPVEDGLVIAGLGTVEKTVAETGEACSAFNRRTGDEYSISIAQTTSNAADVSLYMTLSDFDALFGEEADYFNAYASGEELALDQRYLARTVVPEDMDKISIQMEDSMSSFSKIMMAMAVPIYLVLVYLLTKTVIDRSARSISYMKVFGYRNAEVNGLYVRPITYWTLFSLIASLPITFGAIGALLKFAFSRFSGNFPISIPFERLALLVVVGMATYAIVAFMHVRRIKAVPLELAMKVQE